MLKIALCDDDEAELDTLTSYIDKYKATYDSEMTYDCFANGMELLSRTSAGEFYDLIFLDIVMPAINGMDVAREIYADNQVTQIVFLTTSQDFAVDSYSVSALDYILKPINDKSFRRVMQRFLSKHREQEEETIIIQEKSSILQISLHTLCYVEVFDHYLLYHLSDADTVRCRQSLAQIECILKQNKKFFKTHRSYIINLDYVHRLEQGCVTMTNGDRIPVSRANNKLLSDLFLKYKFERNGDEHK